MRLYPSPALGDHRRVTSAPAPTLAAVRDPAPHTSASPSQPSDTDTTWGRPVSGATVTR